MPDPLFQTLLDDTETASWAPAAVVRDRARRRTRRTRAAAVVGAAALAVAAVVGGVALAGPVPGASPAASPSPSSVAAIGDELFLAPADVDPDYRIAAEGEATTGSWTYESVMEMLGCQPGARIDPIDWRDRSLVRGTAKGAKPVSQRIARYRPGDAARYLQQVRDRVAACKPGDGTAVTIGAQRFAGEDALMIEHHLIAGNLGALVLIRQGDLVTQYEVAFDRDAQPTMTTAGRAADRLCAGIPVC
jgi:hypothetical protein